MKSLTTIALLGSLAAAMATGGEAHGYAKKPQPPTALTAAPEYDHWNMYVFWFTQGTNIGCKAPTGKAVCDRDHPCCDTSGMEPTLTDPNHLTYPIESIPEGKEATLAEQAKANGASLRVAGKLLAEEDESDFKAADWEDNLLHMDVGTITDPNKSPMALNPWMAPGYAPVQDPCGVLGGWDFDNARDYIAGPGHGFELYRKGVNGPMNDFMPDANLTIPAGTYGTDMLRMEVNRKMQEAQGKPYELAPEANVWKAGDEAEVSYFIAANHGGGYQYRLCKLEKLMDGTMDEACFQENPLEFAGDSTWFQAGSDAASRVAFDAVDVNDGNSKGVMPKGSTWRKNPLPACAGASGGSTLRGSKEFACDKPQFTPIPYKDGAWGYGIGEPTEDSPALNSTLADFSIIDKVKVPDVDDGNYVVQWRWDSEQTPQVWTQCSIVKIEK